MGAVFRPILAAVIAIGHPIPFWLYLLVGPGDLGKRQFLGLPLFVSDSTNVYRINLLLYVPYALGLYCVWIAFQSQMLKERRGWSWEDFASRKFTIPYLAFCGLGFLNLNVWANGMEMNVFGFIFFLPLLVLTVVVGVLELRVFFKGKSPAPASVESSK